MINKSEFIDFIKWFKEYISMAYTLFKSCRRSVKFKIVTMLVLALLLVIFLPHLVIILGVITLLYLIYETDKE